MDRADKVQRQRGSRILLFVSPLHDGSAGKAEVAALPRFLAF